MHTVSQRAAAVATAENSHGPDPPAIRTAAEEFEEVFEEAAEEFEEEASEVEVPLDDEEDESFPPEAEAGAGVGAGSPVARAICINLCRLALFSMWLAADGAVADVALAVALLSV